MVPGLINLDFADVKNIMSEMGLALMGTGIASGESRAVEAAQKAISSPLLEDNSIQGARGVLLSITGGPDMTLFEVNEASSLVQAEAHDEANIIFGTVIDDAMGDEMRVTVIATGFNASDKKREIVSENMASFTTRKKEDISKPTFMRKKEEAKSEKPVVIRMGMINDDENIDYETPAFLRKQAD
jgi:cell division protein FtsZ